MLRINVDLSGAIANDAVFPIMHRYKLDVEEKLAARATAMIRAYLPTQYMYLGNNGGNPHDNPIPPNAGLLQSTIHHDLVADDYQLVKGDDVIYGPWIEGVAVGNTFTWPGRIKRGLSPRFPGYHAFRHATQVIENIAFEVAESALPYYLEQIDHY